MLLGPINYCKTQDIKAQDSAFTVQVLLVHLRLCNRRLIAAKRRTCQPIKSSKQLEGYQIYQFAE